MLVGPSFCHDGNVCAFDFVSGFVAFVTRMATMKIDIPGVFAF